MTRKEQLYERYEDALFALLMDEVAQSEGEKAAEECVRLNADPSAAVPEETNKRSMRTIRRHFVRQQARTAGRFTARAFGRVAMVAGVVMMLFTVAFASSDSFRVNTLNLIIETFDYGTVYSFHEDPPQPEVQIDIEWIPDGYTLSSETAKDSYAEKTYRNSAADYFKVCFVRSGGMSANIDTEDAIVESLEINGCSATYIEKREERQIFIILPNNASYMQIIANELDREELIQLSENVFCN